MKHFAYCLCSIVSNFTCFGISVSIVLYHATVYFPPYSVVGVNYMYSSTSLHSVYHVCCDIVW